MGINNSNPGGKKTTGWRSVPHNLRAVGTFGARPVAAQPASCDRVLAYLPLCCAKLTETGERGTASDARAKLPAGGLFGRLLGGRREVFEGLCFASLPQTWRRGRGRDVGSAPRTYSGRAGRI